MTLTFIKNTIILLFTLFCFHVVAADPNVTPINRIAVIVNDQAITETNVREMIHTLESAPNQTGTKLSAAALRKQAIDELIARALQMQIAKLASVTISDEELNTAIAHIAADHHLTVAQLPAALASQGLDMSAFKKQLKDQLTIQKFQQQQLAGTITIKPKEIDALAKKLAQQPEKQAAEPQSQMLYHFAEMIIPLPQKPNEEDLHNAKQTFSQIAEKINQNIPFDQISETVLHKPITDLGWRSPEQIPSGFMQLVAKMKPGQVAPPARSADGIHIIKLIDTKTLTNQQTSPANSQIVTETHVRHILLKKDPLAPKSTLERRLLSLRNELVHGGDFATLAKENSEDPGSVSNGGDLGWVKPETLDPKFEAAMNELKINEISMPVESQFGWHLIEVLGRKEISDPETALKLKAQQILFQQKMERAIKQLISELKSRAYIKIF